MLTLNCSPDVNLNDLTQSELEMLVTDIKDELAVTPNCNFKPCGYDMDVGSDIDVIDRNSFKFNLQGSAVRKTGEERVAEIRDVPATVHTVPWEKLPGASFVPR